MKHSGVFLIQIGDTPYVIRALTKGEYKACQQASIHLTEEDIEDALVRQSILWPDTDPDNLIAGSVPKLAEYISAVSGFNETADLKTLIQTERNLAGTADFQFDALLSTAFKIKTEDVDNMDAFQLARAVARAEQILGTEFTIFTEEEMKEIEKKQAKTENKRKHWEETLDKRAESQGKKHKRHRKKDKYVAPGGAPEEVEKTKLDLQRRRETEGWLAKRGIKKKILPADLQYLADHHVPEAVTIEDDIMAAVRYLRNKDKTHSGVDYKSVMTDAST